MASLYATLAADLAATVFDTAAAAAVAQTVTYTHAGSTKDLPMITGQITGETDSGERGRANIYRRTALIPADATTGITAPTPGDSFTADSIFWQVAQVRITAGALARLECVGVAELSRNNPQYKQEMRERAK